MTQPKRPLKVFLCHAHADRDAVRALYTRLVNDGVDAWVDKEKLLPGQDWELEIRKAVREADVVLVCLSKQFNDEGFRQREVRWALETAMNKPEGDIFIIPARLEECDTLENLRKWHWVDLFEEDGYEKLINTLRMRAGKIRATLRINKQQTPIVSSKILTGNKISSSINNHKEKRSSKTVYMNYLVVVLLLLIMVISIFGFPSLLSQVAANPTATYAVFLNTPTNTLGNLTLTLAATPTSLVAMTPTSLPSEIIDIKGISMVFIPDGEFKMGSDNGEKNELPVHQIKLTAFYIDKFEVTNTQYKICVDAKGCLPPDNEIYYTEARYADHPVTFINWYMAEAYCSWRDARLPTEAEWEKAALGSGGTEFPWGDSIDCTYANYRGTNGHCVGDSTSVGSYEKGKSIYGVYDMVGNALELVSSIYAEYPYDANDGREGLNVGGLRVIRGGSWNNKESDVRSTTRAWVTPSAAEFDYGFRCAKDAP